MFGLYDDSGWSSDDLKESWENYQLKLKRKRKRKINM